jgi:hypothetical protein
MMKAALVVLFVLVTLTVGPTSDRVAPEEKAEKAAKEKAEKPRVEIRVSPEPPGGPSPPGTTVSFWSYAFGKCYSVAVTQAALDKAPVWKDDSDNPPVAARKAMRLADRLKDKLVKDNDKYRWKREEAALQEAGEGQWYWVVSYKAVYRGRCSSGVAPFLHLVVLMDGTVVEPKVIADRPSR